MARATETRSKHPSEVRNISISFVNVLDSGESLTGTPTLSATPSGLTFASAQTNAAAVTINGVSVAIGKAVLARVSGGSSGITYKCEASCGTTATPAQTIIVEFDLTVRDN